ncbi:MAG: D-alanyl-D-alanine carboxypeptidase family protein [Limnochordia bacterium]|jgi:D-alanyl-D-alanine carboxypeptidase (penicillin-binding protein 5/6)
MKAKKLIIVAAIVALLSAPLAAQGVAFDIPAESAILISAESGQVLFAKNETKPLPPASLTKIMTMLLAMEAVDRGVARLEDAVPISRYASSMGGSQVFLSPNEKFTLEELLEAVAIASGNDASVAVAEHLAGTEANFVGRMNQRAKELGMKDTVFANASGLPTPEGEPACITTAHDVAIMAREIIVRFPKVLEWTSIWQKNFRHEPRPFVLTNTNRLIRTYPGADGLKTGHTEAAGFCLAATAKRDDVRLISVVMRTESDTARLEQTTRVLDYGFRAFEQVFAVVAGENVGLVPVPEGRKEEVAALAQGDLKLMALRGSQSELKRELKPLPDLKAPVTKGQVIGDLVVTLRDEALGSVPVVAAEDVPRANLLIRLFRWVRDFFRGIFRR